MFINNIESIFYYNVRHISKSLCQPVCLLFLNCCADGCDREMGGRQLIMFWEAANFNLGKSSQMSFPPRTSIRQLDQGRLRCPPPVQVMHSGTGANTTTAGHILPFICIVGALHHYQLPTQGGILTGSGFLLCGGSLHTMHLQPVLTCALMHGWQASSCGPVTTTHTFLEHRSRRKCMNPLSVPLFHAKLATSPLSKFASGMQ